MTDGIENSGADQQERDGDARIGSDGSITTHVRCTQCRYDLHALPADAQCPECGRSIADSLRADPKGSKISRRDGVPIQTTGRIEQHVPCISCHHDLCGVEATANCPECGRAVPDSLDGGRIAFAPRQHRDEVFGGAYLILVTTCVLGGLLIAATAASSARAQDATAILNALLLVALLLAVFTLPMGWLMATSEDETCAASVERERARRGSRRSIIIAFVSPFGLLPAFVIAALLPAGIGVTVGLLLLTCVVVLTSIGIVSHCMLAMTYIELTGIHLSRPPARWLTRLVRWLTLGTLITVIVIGAMAALDTRGYAYDLGDAVVLSVVGGAAAVGLGYAVVIGLFAHAIHREAQHNVALQANGASSP